MISLNCGAGSVGELDACRWAQAESQGPTVHRATHLQRDVHKAKLAVEVRRGAQEQAYNGQE